MTRKDFVLIAAAVAAARQTSPGTKLHSLVEEGIDAVGTQLAVVLARTNPRFDAEKFLAACGMERA